jgi:DivIVA domain-containing protein
MSAPTHAPGARGRTGVLRLTPERIREAQFPRAPLGRRGLAEEEVHRFLDQIADEVATRDAADAATRATIDHYKHALARWQAERNDDLAGTTRSSVDAVEILTRAQREADAYVGEAREYGQRLVEDARAQAQAILDEARAQARARAKAEAKAAWPKTDQPPDTCGVASERSHLLWTRTFLASLRTVETQLRSAREALSSEFDKPDRKTPQDAPTP